MDAIQALERGWAALPELRTPPVTMGDEQTTPEREAKTQAWIDGDLTFDTDNIEHETADPDNVEIEVEDHD